jgi:hypothetical protein
MINVIREYLPLLIAKNKRTLSADGKVNVSYIFIQSRRDEIIIVKMVSANNPRRGDINNISSLRD